MKCILGKKLDMTQVWDYKGRVTPVTIVKAGPCYVTQVKTKAKDGYEAVQLGFAAFGTTTLKKMTKAMQGHLKDLPALSRLREHRISGSELKRGDVIDVAIFSPGDMVRVVGTSKGKGFQGVVKRHGFHGSPKTHGHKDQLRMPGSIGAGGVHHVRKGMRMAGGMRTSNVILWRRRLSNKDAFELVFGEHHKVSFWMRYGKAATERKQPLNLYGRVRKGRRF